MRPQRPSSWPWRALRDRAGRQHPAVTSDMAKSLSGPPLPAPPPWEEAEPQPVCCPAWCLSCPGAQSGGEEPHVERDRTCCVEPTLPCHSLGPPEVGERECRLQQDTGTWGPGAAKAGALPGPAQNPTAHPVKKDSTCTGPLTSVSSVGLIFKALQILIVLAFLRRFQTVQVPLRLNIDMSRAKREPKSH